MPVGGWSRGPHPIDLPEGYQPRQGGSIEAAARMCRGAPLTRLIGLTPGRRDEDSGSLSGQRTSQQAVSRPADTSPHEAAPHTSVRAVQDTRKHQPHR